MHESEKWKWSCLVVSDSLRPHGLQPTRLLRPWDFPGKSPAVGAIAFSRMPVYLWLIHADRRQKPIRYCKGIILQLKINFLKIKKKECCGTQNWCCFSFLALAFREDLGAQKSYFQPQKSHLAPESLGWRRACCKSILSPRVEPWDLPWAGDPKMTSAQSKPPACFVSGANRYKHADLVSQSATVIFVEAVSSMWARPQPWVCWLGLTVRGAGLPSGERGEQGDGKYFLLVFTHSCQ